MTKQELLAKYNRVAEDKSQLQQFAQDVINGEIGGGGDVPDNVVLRYEKTIDELTYEDIKLLKIGDIIEAENTAWQLCGIDANVHYYFVYFGGIPDSQCIVFVHYIVDEENKTATFDTGYEGATGTTGFAIFPLRKHMIDVNIDFTDLNDPNNYIAVKAKYYEYDGKFLVGLSEALSNLSGQSVDIHDSDDFNNFVKTLGPVNCIQIACLLGTMGTYNFISSVFIIEQNGDALYFDIIKGGTWGTGYFINGINTISSLSAAIISVVGDGSGVNVSGGIRADDKVI